MQRARTIRLPIDHVEASIASWPLASESSLKLPDLVELHPCLDGSPTGELWRAAEATLFADRSGFSIDEAVAIRDRFWFPKSHRSPEPLHTYLPRIARWYLEDVGAVAVPRTFDDQGTADPVAPLEALTRQRWKWLALELPQELLLAALGTTTSGPAEVEFVSPLVARMLADGGFAESHLHLGAGMEFATLWVATQHAAADVCDFHEGILHSPGAELREGRDLAPWLIRAMLARYVLGAFLAWGRQQGDLRQFLAKMVRPRMIRTHYPGAYEIVVAALADLSHGRIDRRHSFRHFQQVYGIASGVLHNRLPTRLLPAEVEEILLCDPLATLFPPAEFGRRTPEMQYVAEALAHLKRDYERPDRDRLFERAFWQTVRVRGLFFRHVVQRPMKPGLLWFTRFYDRLWPARAKLTRPVQLATAARTSGIEQGLRALEFRVCPSNDRGEMLRVLEAAQDLQCRLGDRCEVGLVFHFAKDRGRRFMEGFPDGDGATLNASPSANPGAYRYSHYFNRQQALMFALRWLIANRPSGIQVIRGLDVCTDEWGVPNWVLAPLLAEIHECARGVTRHLRQRYRRSIPCLRTTLHAGEDFVHLLSGLRAIDEAIEHFELREGDRIGHGMALGIEVRDWVRRTGRVAMPREDRLFDLVWQWAWYQRRGGSFSGGPRWEWEIERLSRELFDKSMSPFELLEFRRRLNDARYLRAAGFPNGPVPRRRSRLVNYLTMDAIYRRGREIISVETHEDGNVLADLQAGIRQKLGARGITVEVNPTSNLLIGDLTELTTHPLWRLNPPLPAEHDGPPVAVCIGSDDPLTFNTDLRQEFQCLADALKLAGLSDKQSFDWLDETRRMGLVSRFTVATYGRR